MCRYIPRPLCLITVMLALFAWPSVSWSDYEDECVEESCDTEEVRELHESYREECIDEACSREEVIEIAGQPQTVDQMLSEFRRRGYEVLSDDPNVGNCTVTSTDSSCYGVVLFCKDNYSCPDGPLSSSWHACGACLGLPF